MKDQKFIVEKIMTQYTEKEITELDEFKALDAQVKLPANLFAYIFGSISAIIMGSGMSLIMTNIGSHIGISDPLIPGVLIGAVGMLMAIINYPIFKGILDSRKDRYSKQIIELSNKIINK